MDAVTQIITTFAGTGEFRTSGDGGPATSAEIKRPVNLVVDSSGNLFIADQTNHRIRKVDTSGNISTVAGTTAGFCGDGGPATSAKLSNPKGVEVDSSGNLFIADTGNQRIRKVDTSGNISTVAGGGGSLGDGGPATSARLNFPSFVVVDPAGNLFIGDTSNHRVRKVDTSGNISTVAGNGTQGFSGDSGPATSVQLNFPTGVAVDSSGNLFFADLDNQRIRKVESVAAAVPTPTPTPTPVPGVSTGGLIGLSVLMAGAAAFVMLRRRLVGQA